MAIKPDHWIRKMALEHKMIDPFVDHSVCEGVISYGLSAYGYDIRVADEFKIFTNVNTAVVDPKNFDPKSFVGLQGRCLHHSAQLVCAFTHGRGLSDTAERVRAHHR